MRLARHIWPSPKILLATLLFTCLSLICIASILDLKAELNVDMSAQPLRKFSSYQELKEFLNRSRYKTVWGFVDFKVPFSTAFPALMSLKKTMNEASASYSRTNIQVEGVDEADVVKCDGKYIYIASSGRILIIRAYPPEDLAVLAEMKSNGTAAEIFINGDRLVVIESTFGKPIIQLHHRGRETIIKIFDVSDRNRPILIRKISTDGWYFGSRMIGSYVYLLSIKPACIVKGEVQLPLIIDGKNIEEIPASQIYYVNSSDWRYGFITLLAVNIQDVSERLTHKTFLLGYSRAIYMSKKNLYLAISKIDNKRGMVTEIYRIRVDGCRIRCEASGCVPGRILNQFSMDEYKGYFRIATTMMHLSRAGRIRMASNIYVLDMNLKVVGRIENIAPDERMHSARFLGTRCYLVTFKKVDPLFVVSLEDPKRPKILGKLKIPGYSDYLHPYGRNYLIGIGKETVEAEEGDFAWYQGVKISLFDVSDVKYPREISKYVIGDRGTDSPILRDHKAFLFDEERNMLVIPILLAEIDEDKYSGRVPPNAYGDYVWQGIYVFAVNETGIFLRGRITHIKDPEVFAKSGFYFHSKYAIKRALYIGDFLYSISDGMIKVNDLRDLRDVAEVNLP
ncbi:MAG TPA: hypothetical protein ENG65_01455 [Candidatus Bathyarchaeota archaeon]|nr:hypothetical protein [Candidatus Bathyarchaeota archaeon]